MEGVQVMPSPVAVLPPNEVESLLRKAAAARTINWGGGPRESAGLSLEVTGSGGPDQLVWGTFGPNGLLALFRDARLLATQEKGLGEITRVQPLVLPGLSQFALMVDDLYDEMTGAYLKEERRRIYVWDGRGLRQVYQGLLASRQFRHARWENPKGPNAWRLQRTLGEISVQDGVLTEQMKEQRLEAPGSPQADLPPESAFRMISEQKRQRRLTWNARLRRFEPAAA